MVLWFESGALDVIDNSRAAGCGYVYAFQGQER
ncbi:MAG: hypothetical protein JWR24_2779 [Actinoallomurus sp.]|jgi:hypothetical protein|nr:hypothetical protein [Actinoallomurus sp.]